MICGASASGKTTFVVDFIKNLQQCFQEEQPQKIYYFYGIYQPLFTLLEKQYGVDTRHGAPTVSDIDEITQQGVTALIILDDLMDVVTNNLHLCKLFTEGCHHRKMCTMFLTQNLFHGGRYARTIARNTHYFVFTKSPRNASTVAQLANQIFDKSNRTTVLHAYKDICAQDKKNVLLLDLHPHSDERFRIRTDVFSDTPVIFRSTNE